MHWIEVAAIIFGFLGFLAVGAVLALRLYHNPLLLTGLVPVLWQAIKPLFFKYIVPYFARMSPDKEKEMQDCFRRGGVWDPVKKRCKR